MTMNPRHYHAIYPSSSRFETVDPWKALPTCTQVETCELLGLPMRRPSGAGRYHKKPASPSASPASLDQGSWRHHEHGISVLALVHPPHWHLRMVHPSFRLLHAQSHYPKITFDDNREKDGYLLSQRPRVDWPSGKRSIPTSTQVMLTEFAGWT